MKPGSKETATKRIKKEIADLAKEDLGGITLTPDESNIFSWRAVLPGPIGSPYEGGMFEVDIRIPVDYPFSPPQLSFLTKVYHCNIAHTGAICLDLLKTAWSPALSLYKVILSLSSLLTDPNPSDPLVPAIAQEYRKNKAKHDATAREFTKLHAQPKASIPPPAPAAATAPTRPTAPRLRSIPRPDLTSNASSSASTSRVPQVAGSRRTHSQANGTNGTGRHDSGPIVLSDDEDEVEVLESSGRGANGAGNGEAAVGGRRGTKKTKRDHADGEAGEGIGARGDDDDVIVID